jgi:hypothetical protein
MSDRTRRAALRAAAAGVAAMSIVSCATIRMEDGGIVGTGNRIDCEAYAGKGGTRDPVPEECKRENRR